MSLIKHSAPVALRYDWPIFNIGCTFSINHSAANSIDWRHNRSKHICRAKPNKQRFYTFIFLLCDLGAKKPDVI